MIPMNSSRLRRLLPLVHPAVLLILCLATISTASASIVVPYISMTNLNGAASWPSGTAYNNNVGIVFQSGPTGPYPIDWIQLDLSTSSYTGGGPVSLTLSLRNATSSTAYSAAAGTTEYATDTITFSTPAASLQFFTLTLTSTQIPNITGYDLAADTVYSLVFYNPTAPIAIRRNNGTTANTANTLYTVDEGFTMLNTLRNNSTASSSAIGAPAYAISLGTFENPAVPEPGTWAAAALLVGTAAWVHRQRRRRH
jgi:hypothetical protein